MISTYSIIFLPQDDYRVCINSGIISKGGKLPCPVDASGRFTDDVTHFSGQHVKVSPNVLKQYTSLIKCSRNVDF